VAKKSFVTSLREGLKEAVRLLPYFFTCLLLLLITSLNSGFTPATTARAFLITYVPISLPQVSLTMLSAQALVVLVHRSGVTRGITCEKFLKPHTWNAHLLAIVGILGILRLLTYSYSYQALLSDFTSYLLLLSVVFVSLYVSKRLEYITRVLIRLKADRMIKVTRLSLFILACLLWVYLVLAELLGLITVSGASMASLLLGSLIGAALIFPRKGNYGPILLFAFLDFMILYHILQSV